MTLPRALQAIPSQVLEVSLLWAIFHYPLSNRAFTSSFSADDSDASTKWVALYKYVPQNKIQQLHATTTREMEGTMFASVWLMRAMTKGLILVFMTRDNLNEKKREGADMWTGSQGQYQVLCFNLMLNELWIPTLFSRNSCLVESYKTANFPPACFPCLLYMHALDWQDFTGKITDWILLFFLFFIFIFIFISNF